MLRVLCVEHCVMPPWSVPVPPHWEISAGSIEDLEDVMLVCQVGVNAVLPSDTFTWHPLEAGWAGSPRRHVMALGPHDDQTGIAPLRQIGRDEAWALLVQGQPVILEARCWMTTVVPMPPLTPAAT